jgi:hypothetical protein
MVSLIDSEKWAPLIGKLFIAFGTVERATHDCIRAWSNDVVYKHVKGMPFARRIDLAIDLVATQPFSDTSKATFIADFQATKILAQQRNVIAHSPLVLVLFSDEGNAAIYEALASNTDEARHIEFDELEDIVKEAEALADKINYNLATFRRESVDRASSARIAD